MPKNSANQNKVYTKYVIAAMQFLQEAFGEQVRELRQLPSFEVVEKVLKDTEIFRTTRRIDLEKSVRQRMRGNEYHKQKKFNTAIKVYTEALALCQRGDTDWCLCLANRAVSLYMSKGTHDLVQAKEDSFACIHGYSTEAKAKIFKRLGFICKALYEIKEAICHMEAAMRKDPRGLCVDLSQVRQEITRLMFNPPRRQTPLPVKKIKKDEDGNEIIPFKIKMTEAKGRGIGAMNDLIPGDLVMTRKPLAVSVKPGKCYCEACGQKTYAHYPCDNCSDAIFCSETCYLNNCKAHKVICGLLNVLQHPSIGRIAVLAIKLLLLEDTRWLNLRKHESDRSNQNSLNFNLLGGYICYFTGLRNLKKLVSALYIVSCNGIEINDCVLALYYDVSFFNHSCDPNVDFLFRDNSICDVRAIKTIALGSEITVDYGVNFYDTPRCQRQEKLNEQYFFECICKPCRNYWPTRLLLKEKPVTEDEGHERMADALCELVGIINSQKEISKDDFCKLRVLYEEVERRGLFNEPSQMSVNTIKCFRKIMPMLGSEMDELDEYDVPSGPENAEASGPENAEASGPENAVASRRKKAGKQRKPKERSRFKESDKVWEIDKY